MICTSGVRIPLGLLLLLSNKYLLIRKMATIVKPCLPQQELDNTTFSPLPHPFLPQSWVSSNSQKWLYNMTRWLYLLTGMTIWQYDFIYWQVWESSASVLCFVGDDDRCLNPAITERFIQLVPKEHTHRFQLLRYPDTGHFIDPPYSPCFRTSFHGLSGSYM